MLRFSVIIPVYNTAPYLAACLDSVFAQPKEVEVICVNDGSTDPSAEILQAYKEQHPQMVVLTQTNAGLSAARNAGIRAATGEYVLFLDSDDCLQPNALADLENAVVANSPDIVAFNSTLWFAENTEEERTEPNTPFNHTEARVFNCGMDYLRRFVQQRGWGPSAACFYAYRREMLKENRLAFPVGMLHEDELFVPQALCLAGQVVTLPQSLYLYRMRTTSIVHDQRPRNTDDKRKIAYLLFDFFRIRGLRSRYTDRIVYNLSLNAAIGLAMQGRKLTNRALLLRTAHTPKEYIKALTVGRKRYKGDFYKFPV